MRSGVGGADLAGLISLGQVAEDAAPDGQDQGVGIAGEHLERISSRASTTKEFGSGSGTGLTVVRQITQDMFGGRGQGGLRVVRGTTLSKSRSPFPCSVPRGGGAQLGDEKDRGAGPFAQAAEGNGAPNRTRDSAAPWTVAVSQPWSDALDGQPPACARRSVVELLGAACAISDPRTGCANRVVLRGLFRGPVGGVR